MYNSVIELIFAIVFALVSGAFGVFFAYLQSKIKSERIGIALERMEKTAYIAVARLEQEYAEEWKAQSGGKLSKEQIAELKKMSKELILSLIDEPAINLLDSVGIELEEMIRGLTEKAVLMLKNDKAC